MEFRGESDRRQQGASGAMDARPTGVVGGSGAAWHRSVCDARSTMSCPLPSNTCPAYGCDDEMLSSDPHSVTVWRQSGVPLFRRPQRCPGQSPCSCG